MIYSIKDSTFIMHSFLIVSKQNKIADDYIQKLCEQSGINDLDITRLEPQKGSIGIEEIRKFQKKLFLKPLKGETKAAIIKSGELLTAQAQNALLKALEEPPNHTIIILTASNKDLLLPTIQSRCTIVELDLGKLELSKEEIEELSKLLTSFNTKGVGERLKIAQDLSKNKDEALVKLEKLILAARFQLTNSICHSERREESSASPNHFNDLNHFIRIDLPVQKLLNIISSLQKAYTIIKTTNVNLRLALENLFLNL